MTFKQTYSVFVDFRAARFLESVDFIDAKFRRGVDFGQSVFCGQARFTGQCQFGDVAIFDRVTFTNRASFQGSTFHKGASFEYCLFSKEDGVDFSRVQFPVNPKFRHTRFGNKSTFRGSVFSDKRSLIFNGCNLAGVSLSELPAFPSNLSFENVTWPRVHYLNLFRGRLLIEDELQYPASTGTLDYYRKLHKYYYDRSEFRIASEFYVSFMVVNRRVNKRGFFAKAYDLFYEVFSRYGESAKRPFCALLGLWSLVPILLLLLGIELEASSETVTRYTLDWSGTPLFMTADYWKTFLLNISLSTMFRGNELRPELVSLQHLLLMVETLFNGLLISFLAIGLRRSFVPKKPF